MRTRHLGSVAPVQVTREARARSRAEPYFRADEDVRGVHGFGALLSRAVTLMPTRSVSGILFARATTK